MKFERERWSNQPYLVDGVKLCAMASDEFSDIMYDLEKHVADKYVAGEAIVGFDGGFRDCRRVVQEAAEAWALRPTAEELDDAAESLHVAVAAAIWARKE